MERVQGDNLRCPFHGWQFNVEGQCQSIPYCDRIPRRAQVGSYPVNEINGVIFMWYDVENGGAPTFDVPEFTEFADPKWSRPIRLQYTIETHVQEMAENALDMAHFPMVHGTTDVPEIEHIIEDGATLEVRFKSKREIFRIMNKMDINFYMCGSSMKKLDSLQEHQH